MSEQEAYCLYCAALRAKDAGVVHVQITESDIRHSGESVYGVHVFMGGDKDICSKFADIVRKHVTEVLGLNIVVDLTPKPTGKPNQTRERGKRCRY